MSLFWLSLAISLALVVGASIYLTRTGLDAFRTAKRLSRGVGEELERIERASGEIERHLALAAESGTQLEASLARLRVSRARLQVLTSAFAEARASVDRWSAVVPRK
jgi:hypothetical protein